MKRTIRLTCILTAVAVLSTFLFRAFPEFSASWTDNLIRPLGRSLHRITARIPFPLFEVLFILLFLHLCIGFLSAVFNCIKKTGFTPVFKWITSSALIVSLIFSSYVYLWYPAYWNGNTVIAQAPDSHQIKWLCEELISELNDESFDFPPPEIILDATARKCGLNNIHIKAARYPEWMHLFHISGMYVPWTGEAVVNILNPRATIPFTAVHELMHLNGIADEGMANSAAWEICKSTGGYFYTSAMLWVLKYALEFLENEPETQDALFNRMSPDLYNVFSGMCGRPAAGSISTGIFPSALGLTGCISSYPDVIKHILNNP